jgi:hypothetical protein
MDCHFEDPRKLKPNETVLRAGSLEPVLIDRTAKRSDRPIDLRPRKFHLFKYMMQRSDLLQTRAALFDDVWHYKFVAQRNGAPSVTESLVSSGTTLVELASVQRSALLASRPARRATADGYADLGRPDQALQAHKEDLEPSVCSLMLASVEEEPI